MHRQTRARTRTRTLKQMHAHTQAHTHVFASACAQLRGGTSRHRHHVSARAHCKMCFVRAGALPGASASPACVLAIRLACTHNTAQPFPLTTPPPASAAAPPPPLHTNVDVDACHTQCAGALCAERCGSRKGRGADRPASINCKHQAHQGPAPRPLPLRRSPLSQERHHTQTRPQIIHAGRGKGRSAAPGGREHCA